MPPDGERLAVTNPVAGPCPAYPPSSKQPIVQVVPIGVVTVG